MWFSKCPTGTEPSKAIQNYLYNFQILIVGINSKSKVGRENDRFLVNYLTKSFIVLPILVFSFWCGGTAMVWIKLNISVFYDLWQAQKASDVKHKFCSDFICAGGAAFHVRIKWGNAAEDLQFFLLNPIMHIRYIFSWNVIQGITYCNTLWKGNFLILILCYPTFSPIFHWEINFYLSYQKLRYNWAKPKSYCWGSIWIIAILYEIFSSSWLHDHPYHF